jgi:hypothetical protein
MVTQLPPRERVTELHQYATRFALNEAARKEQQNW